MDIDKLRAALALSEDKRKLEKRLRAARHCLPASDRPLFERARFDYANRRLIGDGIALVDTGTVCLVAM